MLTLPYKFILPALFPLSIINALLVWGPNIRWIDFKAVPPIFLVFWIAFTALELWTAWHIKSVLLDETNKKLYVSNYRKEISIPFSDIERVTQFPFHDPKKVTIHLRTPTEFGQKIVFLATYQFFSGFLKEHPIVDELRNISSSNPAA
jgi:Co/Zn/Cd efflux system component